MKVIQADALYANSIVSKIIVAMMDDREPVNELNRHGFKRYEDYVTVSDIVDYIYDHI